MVDRGGRRDSVVPATPDAAVVAVAAEILAAVPGGYTWLLPMRDDHGQVVDFRVAAVSGHSHDIYGRGATRLDAVLTDLYPHMAGGSLWELYQRVLTTGAAEEMAEFRYEEKRAGVVADSRFRVSVEPVLGGLLVSWQRLDEAWRREARTELLGGLGWAEYDLITGRSEWSPGMYRIFERDPAAGPLSRAEQSAALLPDDRGVSETAWQTLDSGAASDVTLRFQPGPAVKYLRILSDIARDADGVPLKIYAVVQDVTARETSRTALERLSDQLRTREITALAEHRLAAQLQNLIQPVPREPVTLPGLQAMIGYQPAESTVRVGGDWYHAHALPDGRVVLAIGDVAGHGLPAASDMAHLRFALVSWLSIGIDDPGTLLAYLNRLCVQLTITATAVISVFDPATTRLRWVRAGHMPPLFARAGRAASLAAPAGVLLGADPAATYRSATAHLRPDDLVLFYTDGLVERRGTDTATRLAEVRRTLAAASASAGDQSLTALQALLQPANPDDDTCTMTVRILPFAS